MMKILNRHTNKVIIERDVPTMKELVEIAVKEGISFKDANLSGADLYGANLFKANLFKANLVKANLFKANLYGANLSGADLSGADLSKANLYSATLSGADLYKANLYGATLNGATLNGVLKVRTFTAGDSNRLCFTYKYNNEQRWQLGCFNGNYKETKKIVKEKYGKNSHYYKLIKAMKDSV